MSEHRIKLAEAPQTEPASLPMPLDEALRWVSPHEDKVTGQVMIFLTQHAYLNCTGHAASDLEHEVGGVLIGQVCREEQDGRLYIIVEDSIPAQHTQFSPTRLTFTQDSLVQLNNELEECFPGKRMVGWYHTHPRLDVFMSAYDLWLHTHFFREPWQVALVMEPCSVRGGFFCLPEEGQIDSHRYVGFYELADVSHETVVEWTNLEPVEDED
jgi:proteasome lid subunit RPN8/RPN11